MEVARTWAQPPWMCRRLAVVTLGVCFCAGWLLAGESPAESFAPPATGWVRLASANFELYTTAAEDQGRNLLRHFEQLRTILSGTFAARGAEKPVRIIAFRDHFEFEPYAPNPRASGFFLEGAQSDFLVLESTSTETRTAGHEFGHLMIAHSGLRLPAWLNEGLAELYSNVDGSRADGRALVGGFLAGRVLALRRDGWIDLRELVSAGADSRVFQSPAYLDSA